MSYSLQYDTLEQPMEGRTDDVNHMVQQLIATPLVGKRRMGEWTQAEIDYAYHMSTAFKAGLFDDGIRNRESVRLWLARLLNCAPMRLSKKFNRKSKLLGMYFYKKNHAALDAMSPQDRMDRYDAMEAARLRFIKSIGGGYKQQHTQPTLLCRRPHVQSPKKATGRTTAVQSSPKSVSCVELQMGSDILSDQGMAAMIMDDGLPVWRHSMDLSVIDMTDFDYLFDYVGIEGNCGDMMEVVVC
ncbi:hypothetical protein DYB34_004722 [Aphanomyces astaci]|uniref:Uncharacterized protein n=1 Tax=Aphanomyces astaci TaxID=112090 RepID=A0A3R6YP94_APHAT|nr:hypothetical protein DYB34_004722 [Aphanomyces astaci]